jgi:transmembrane sensor
MSWHLKTRPMPDPAEEAARWLLRLEDGKLTSAQQATFEQWVEADPAHRTALERAAGTLEVVSRHAGDGEIVQMREKALRARGKLRMATWAVAASLAGVGATITVAWVISSHEQHAVLPQLAAAPFMTSARPTHFATEVGERATISLPDGSTATLDTHSALDVLYTDAERGIRLLRGQALFEVAKHKLTPFRVYASDRRITAVGTMFNVRLDGDRLRVALIEGKVQVVARHSNEPIGKPIEQVTLSPGEILDTAQGATMSVKVADVARTTSWREGVSVFVDARLADVVAEMNRYVATPITVDKPATGELRVSGVFKTGDPERFAESVANVFPISISHDPNGSVVLSAAPIQK